MSRAPRFLFVGERRSETARRRGWTWRDGRLAAVPLYEALRSMGLDPADRAQCDWVNLWPDGDGDRGGPVPGRRLAVVRVHARLGATVVALGRLVSQELTRRGVDHVAVVHPAARGRIRRRDRYVAHVRQHLAQHCGVTP